MKRIVGILLALVMLLSGFAWAEEGEGSVQDAKDHFVEFEPTLANSAECSSSEWMANGENRALLTLLLWGDLTAHLTDLDEAFIGEWDILKPSYAGRTGTVNLVVYMQAENNDVIVTYSPLLGIASYMLGTKLNDDWLVESLVEELCSDEYYENSLLEMYYVLGELREIAGE